MLQAQARLCHVQNPEGILMPWDGHCSAVAGSHIRSISTPQIGVHRRTIQGGFHRCLSILASPALVPDTPFGISTQKAHECIQWGLFRGTPE